MMSADKAEYITAISYTNRYYEQLSPLILNYIAGLNGFPTRDLSSFRYCELGCGSGTSLLVHAAAHPEGDFVGIDLSADSIQTASDISIASGLTNLTLHAESVGASCERHFDDRFDFITLHGLYSWVSDEVRADIVRFIDRHLKAGGLVQVTYNAAPGSEFRKPLRDIMRRFATPLSADPLEQSALAMSYLQLMLNAKVPFFKVNPDLGRYADDLCKRDLHYVAHEFFNEHWSIFNVEEVASTMAGVGLTFGGSLPLWQNHPEADIPDVLRGFFGPDTPRLVRERHKDFVLNTPFRCDLYIKAERDDPKKLPRSSSLRDMHFRSTVGVEALNLHPKIAHAELPLNTREARLMATMLCDRAMSLGELIDDKRLKHLDPEELTLILNWWVLTGQIRPANASPESEEAYSSRLALNRELLKKAMHEESTASTTLISRTFGCGFAHPKQQALALLALHSSNTDEHLPQLSRLITCCDLKFEADDKAGNETLSDLCAELVEELGTSGAMDLAEQQQLFNPD